MTRDVKEKLMNLIAHYNAVMEVMEHGAAKAIEEEGRAYGGYVRVAKGQVQEYITEKLITIAWVDALGKDSSRIEINANKIRIPICNSYIERIKDRALKRHIVSNLTRYYYGLSVDKHVFIDKKFVLGIECKAYTENAMIKRILVDFWLLKTKYPELKCYLFQLESQLGGDYSVASASRVGSFPTHSIMSYFDKVDLNIVTLLEGDRKVNRPINKPDYFKELKLEHLEFAVEKIIEGIN